MDQNRWPQDLPEQSHTEPMDHDGSPDCNPADFVELQQLFALPTLTELPVGDSSQNVMHIDVFGNPQYTSEELFASYLQQQVMIPNMWEDEFGALPIQFPPAQLPNNFGESSQGMLHNEGYDLGQHTSQPFSSGQPSVRLGLGNPNVEAGTVQGATTSSSRQTQSETGNSSHRPHVPWSIEDVTKLIEAVKCGKKRKRWASIVRSPYFKDKRRKGTDLMEKWRHMMKTEHPKDPEMRKLYIWAREVEAELQ